MKSSGLLLKNLGLTFPSLGVNKDNLDKVLEMDTTQFIGVSDDGLYFTKKEICLPIVQIQWRNFF
jgi:hypothetical protein